MVLLMAASTFGWSAELAPRWLPRAQSNSVLTLTSGSGFWPGPGLVVNIGLAEKVSLEEVVDRTGDRRFASLSPVRSSVAISLLRCRMGGASGPPGTC